jgi:hypothetical protein
MDTKKHALVHEIKGGAQNIDTVLGLIVNTIGPILGGSTCIFANKGNILFDQFVVYASQLQCQDLKRQSLQFTNAYLSG